MEQGRLFPTAQEERALSFDRPNFAGRQNMNGVADDQARRIDSFESVLSEEEGLRLSQSESRNHGFEDYEGCLPQLQCVSPFLELHEQPSGQPVHFFPLFFAL